MSRQLKPECVMVVEDDTLVAQNMALRIAELGYGIAGIMSSGDEALQKIEQLKPDLVLINIMIAGSLDGMETAAKIQLTNKIPVIFLTSDAEHELVTRSLSGNPTWLQLPLKERELELKLELTLLRHRMEEQTRITRLTLERRIAEITQALDSSHQTLRQLQNKQQRDKMSLQRFSDALDDSADSIYLIDRANMRFIDVNQTACERSGYSRGELLGMGPHDIKPYFNRQMLEEEFDRIAATQNRFGIIETFHKCKNNEIYPVEVRVRATAADGRAIVVAIVRDMTVRDKYEQELRQSEEQFRQISQNLQHVLWIRDIKTEQVIYISNAFEKIWGREVAQVYKRPRMLFADIHPEDRERITAAVQSMWKDQHEMDEEYRLLRSDGQTRWLWTHTFPIRDQDGKVYRIGGVTEDITTRKVEDEKMRLSEEKFRMLFENSPIGIGLMSTERRIMEVNPAFSTILGYSQDELVGKNIAEITLPDDHTTSAAAVDKLLVGTALSLTLEKRYQRKDGTAKWCKSIATMVRDSNQQPLFGMGIIEDISERKENEERIRLSEEKLRNLFEHSPIGLALVSLDFYLRDVNQAFCDMLGFSKEELTHKTFIDITHPDDIQADLELGTQLLSGKIPSYSIEKRYITHQGEPLWIKLHGALIRDQHGQPLFGLAMVENIDQEKRAEERRHMQEAAQKAALVREVHHRIKNHLQGVVGLMRQHAQNNEHGGNVIEQAISQINVVATIHGLQGKETGEDINLLQMLTAISNSLRELLPAHLSSPIRVAGNNITLYLNRDESVPIALALNELMVNAIKHGSSLMDISLQCSSEHAIIRIENQGSLPMPQLQPGSGLELVHALLQTEGVNFRYEHDEHRFMAEIILTQPVIHSKSEIP